MLIGTRTQQNNVNTIYDHNKCIFAREHNQHNINKRITLVNKNKYVELATRRHYVVFLCEANFGILRRECSFEMMYLFRSTSPHTAAADSATSWTSLSTACVWRSRAKQIHHCKTALTSKNAKVPHKERLRSVYEKLVQHICFC